MKEIIGIELLGDNLARLARKWGAESIEHLGGRRYAAHKGNEILHMLSDEGGGSIEGEEGFEEVWEAEVRRG